MEVLFAVCFAKSEDSYFEIVREAVYLCADPSKCLCILKYHLYS